MNRRNITTVLAAAAAAMACAPSFAGTPAKDEVGVSVRLADLNLRSPAGAQVALRRIAQAAETICGDRPALVDLGRTALYEACLETTVERAVTQLGAPMVTAAHKGADEPIVAAANTR